MKPEMIDETKAERFSNMRDMVERGRNPNRKGEKHPLAKLSDKQVLEIRKKYECGITQEKIASTYGISRAQVYRITSKKGWSHI